MAKYIGIDTDGNLSTYVSANTMLTLSSSVLRKVIDAFTKKCLGSNIEEGILKDRPLNLTEGIFGASIGFRRLLWVCCSRVSYVKNAYKTLY